MFVGVAVVSTRASCLGGFWLSRRWNCSLSGGDYSLLLSSTNMVYLLYVRIFAVYTEYLQHVLVRSSVQIST